MNRLRVSGYTFALSITSFARTCIGIDGNGLGLPANGDPQPATLNLNNNQHLVSSNCH